VSLFAARSSFTGNDGEKSTQMAAFTDVILDFSTLLKLFSESKSEALPIFILQIQCWVAPACRSRSSATWKTIFKTSAHKQGRMTYTSHRLGLLQRHGNAQVADLHVPAHHEQVLRFHVPETAETFG
jgi:hypothetical protein